MTDGRATKTRTAARKTPTRARTSAARARTTAKTTARTTAAKTSAAKTAAARTSAAKESAASARTAQRRRPARGGEGVSVPVPVLTPSLKVVHVRAPGASYVSDAGRLMAAYLPPPDRLAFYGGLGLAAVIGAIDWPVATAIGLGTMLARRAGRGRGPARRPSAQAR